MHSVIDSASGIRERQRADTTRGLITAARRLTAESGLSGFTIERLCGEVGVSRRTFFNYFASKEDAVLGVPLQREDVEAVTRFLDAGAPRPAAAGLSPTLLADLVDLADARWKTMDTAPESIADLGAAVQREPRLIARLVELVHVREQDDARLIALREHLPEDDLRAVAAAQIVAAMSRATADEFLRAGNTDTFARIFSRRLTAAYELFIDQHAPTGRP
jgi:AcrR family transcriptional regulator